MVLDRLIALLGQAAKITRFPSRQLNGFIPVKVYRSIINPNLGVNSTSKPLLQRITSSFPPCECPTCCNSQSQIMFGC